MAERLWRLPERLWNMASPNADDSLSDEALAARVAGNGHVESFALLVTRYRSRLIALTRRMLSQGTVSTDDAEDIVQEALLAAYEQRRSYRTGQPFRPWLYRITLNRCLDRLRAASRRPYVGGWDADGEVAPETNGPEQMVLADEAERRMQAAVAALPPKHKAVFLLRHLDDLTYEEIATTCGLPIGTVKTYLFRARAALRQTLRADWGDEP